MDFFRLHITGSGGLVWGRSASGDQVRSCPAAKPERRDGREPWLEAVRAAQVLKALSLVSCAGRHGRG